MQLVYEYELLEVIMVETGEYVSHDFTQFCADREILHQFTNPYTPQQNGISERLNRTLIESAKSMLYHVKMPLNFWAKAVNTAVYLHNRSPTNALKDKTPFECWFGKKPNVSNLDKSEWMCMFRSYTRSFTKEARS